MHSTMGLRRWHGLMMIELPELGCTTGGCRCLPLGSVVVVDEAMSGLLIRSHLVRNNVTFQLVHYCIRTTTLARKVLQNGTERTVRTYSTLGYSTLARMGLDVVGCVCCIRGARSSSSGTLSLSALLQVVHLSIVSVKLCPLGPCTMSAPRSKPTNQGTH
jgi:hypothetical protein